MNYVTTFQLSPCLKLKLEYFKKISDTRDGVAAAKTKEVTNTETINTVFNLLSTLPDQGDKMVKMGDVPFLRTSLIYAHTVTYFAFYDNSIKTPATSFYSTHPAKEKELYELLQSLLQ